MTYVSETPRHYDGKYAKWDRCDCCGKPVHPERWATRVTDYDVCGGDDSVGFVLCTRKRCEKKRNAAGGPKERYKLYALQREKEAKAGFQRYLSPRSATLHELYPWAIENCPVALRRN